jgi:hypothetical protein
VHAAASPPLIHIVAQLLHSATATARQALDILGVAGDRQLTESCGERLTLASVAAELAEASAYLDTYTAGRTLPSTYPITADLTFPRFGMIRKLVEQADQSYPMPRSVAASNIAEECAERCGVDFVHAHDSVGIRRRHVGLAQVEAHSRHIEATTQVCAETYLDAVRGCLHLTHTIARQMATEVPTISFAGVSIRLTDVGLTVTP